MSVPLNRCRFTGCRFTGWNRPKTGQVTRSKSRQPHINHAATASPWSKERSGVTRPKTGQSRLRPAAEIHGRWRCRPQVARPKTGHVTVRTPTATRLNKSIMELNRENSKPFNSLYKQVILTGMNQGKDRHGWQDGQDKKKNNMIYLHRQVNQAEDLWGRD